MPMKNYFWQDYMKALPGAILMTDEKDKYESMKYNFFKEYPQLIPFSGFTVSYESYYFTTEYLNGKKYHKRIERL